MAEKGRVCQGLDHINVLKLLDVFEDQRFFYLVVELCAGGRNTATAWPCFMRTTLLITIILYYTIY